MLTWVRIPVGALGRPQMYRNFIACLRNDYLRWIKSHETEHGSDLIFFTRKRIRRNNTKEEDKENTCLDIYDDRVIDAIKVDLNETEC